jgi:hypothetical protein
MPFVIVADGDVAPTAYTTTDPPELELLLELEPVPFATTTSPALSTAKADGVEIPVEMTSFGSVLPAP